MAVIVAASGGVKLRVLLEAGTPAAGNIAGEERAMVGWEILNQKDTRTPYAMMRQEDSNTPNWHQVIYDVLQPVKDIFA